MLKPIVIICCLGVLFLASLYVANNPREITVVAKAEMRAPGRDSYVVTVRRWVDHHRGGSYKQMNDLFGIELSHRGGMPVSAYEVEGSMPVTNITINWPELGRFVVAFDNSFTVQCTLNEGKPNWERK